MDTILQYFAGPLGKVELLATIFSVICVYLATKHNILTWVFGAVGVLLFGYLFYEYNLYSDAGLQLLFYLPLQFVGFWYWRKTASQLNSYTAVRAMSYSFIALTVLGVMGASGINGYLMSTYTDASFPYVDALTTWLSIAAQLLMIAKFRESWVFWVIMDIIAIGVYFSKGLIVTSGLYVVFLFLAIYGGIRWYSDYNKQIKV